MKVYEVVGHVREGLVWCPDCGNTGWIIFAGSADALGFCDACNLSLMPDDDGQYITKEQADRREQTAKEEAEAEAEAEAEILRVEEEAQREIADAYFEVEAIERQARKERDALKKWDMERGVRWDKAKLERFKEAYKAAGSNDIFEFEENQFVVGYAKYLIEYLEEHLRF